MHNVLRKKSSDHENTIANYQTFLHCCFLSLFPMNYLVLETFCGHPLIRYSNKVLKVFDVGNCKICRNLTYETQVAYKREISW